MVKKTLFAVVMPAGTGKSYFLSAREGLSDYVKEADEICMPRATPLLSELRTRAKDTGDWKDYDAELAREIKSRMTIETRLILVAAYDLAKALNAKIIATIAVEKSVWEQNILSRGQDPSKFIKNYEDALSRDAWVFESNASVHRQLGILLDNFTTGGAC